TTISTSGSGTFVIANGNSARLIADTLATDVLVPNGNKLFTVSGLTLNNRTITLNSTSAPGAQLFFDLNPQTLGGTGTVVFTGPSFGDIGNGGNLQVVGPGVTIHGSSGDVTFSQFFADDNQGTIQCDTAGGEIIFSGGSLLTNSGTLAASNGGILAT